ncbi:MAG: XTP/dITP diphosphatase [Thermoplasmata archaeon]
MNVITSNRGKFREFQKELSGQFRVSMKNVDYHEIQTDSLEFVVLHALDELEEYAPLIIDDSGLFVRALNGFPGVYSAYVMDTLGCSGILKLMEQEENREAYFQCIIGLLDHGKKLFKGTCRGSISYKERGTQGFGYDPIFIPSGCDTAFAEMDTSEKNKISHRGKAAESFLDHVKSLS